MILLTLLIWRILTSVNHEPGLYVLEVERVEEDFVKRLVTSLKCGICGRCYKADDINILGHQQDLWFLGAFCPTCRTRYLVAAVIKGDKAIELVTDLTETELSKFENRGKPIADDMLDMHNFFKNFNGDFSRLFSQK